ncbi:MAG TPA: type II toxin-antitoxin system VapC family toxin [Pyrinomonadaceae bacterium]|nr:type II toxin-antitoxin system VapC family toxin [Pyrinomonadaceae bacterium]
MPHKPKAYVLDSWSILSYFHDEPAAERVETIIAEAHEHKIPMFMSVVNVAEVWYIIARRRSQSDANVGIHSLRQLGIQFVDVHWDLAQQAGRFKVRNRMSFADCFAAALAKDKGATLVTGDKEFKQVEREITIEWLKNK